MRISFAVINDELSPAIVRDEILNPYSFAYTFKDNSTWTLIMQIPAEGHLEGLIKHHLDMVVRAKRPCLRPPGEVQSLIPHQSDLNHHCSTSFLQIYLPFWQKHGFIFHGAVGTVVVDYDPCPSTEVCDLELLAMAQRVRFRLIRLMRYMGFTQFILRRVLPNLRT